MAAPCQALDCGAGIGRVTKGLLAKYFERTDLIEPAQNLINKAKINLKKLIEKKKVREFYK